MRGVGWVVLEAWSDEMVEGMAMDLVSRYVSLFNRKHEKKRLFEQCCYNK